MATLSSNVFQNVNEDERLKRLVEELPKMTFGKDYSKVTHNSTLGNINLHDIYAIADQNYPLCMQEVLVFDLDSQRADQQVPFEALWKNPVCRLPQRSRFEGRGSCPVLQKRVQQRQSKEG